MEKEKHGVDRGAVARGLRRSAGLLEHGSVAEAIDDVTHEPGVQHAVEQAVGHFRESGEHVRTERHESPVPATVLPPRMAATVAAVPIKKFDPATIARDGYTAPTPWSGELADVVIVCCSSEKYEVQHQEFIHALGYRMPHFIQVPGGPTMLYGLATVKGFLAKAMGMFVAKAVDLLEVKEVILIAHEACGAYKAGSISLLGELTRRLSGKDIKDVQLEHLRKSARELQAQLGHGVKVRTFYGSIKTNGQKQIHFEPVDFDSRVRS